MSCGTCVTGNTVKGCNNNGGCSGGCNKMNTFDWLLNMEVPNHQICDVVEIRFKNGRKEFYRNINGLSLNIGDAIIVNTGKGTHLGYVALQGELVRLQMRKKKVEDDETILPIYRIAHQQDIQKAQEIREKEFYMLTKTRQIIKEHKLNMKLTDVEYQSDGRRAVFYYSSDERVDFRKLIIQLAKEFAIRVEMRQISMRVEASRIGGIGSCGRELCCSTWLTDFKNVSHEAAKFQNLSLNQNKLLGQCGRLKCCLNYELDTYVDLLKDIPKIKSPLSIQNGSLTLQKTDIFKKIMWFSINNEIPWIPLQTEKVKEIINLNAQGVHPEVNAQQVSSDTVDEINNADLKNLDQKYKLRTNRKKRKSRRKNVFKKQKTNNNV